MTIFTTTRTFINCAILVLLILLTADVSLGQTAARPDRGVMKGASYSVSDIETIGLTNGNVNLSIPLASLPPIAGGKLSFTLSAVYNSKLWDTTRTEHQMDPFYGCPTWTEDMPQLSDRGGWRIFGGYSIQIRDGHEDVDYVIPSPPGTDTCETDSAENYRLQNAWYRVFLVTPDGSEHELRPMEGSQAYLGTRPYLWGYYKDTPNTLGTALRYYSLDGTYISAVINPYTASTYWTIYMKDGTRVTQLSNGIQRITDTNGNSIKIFGDTNGTHYQDEQTGREIRYGTDNKVYYQTVNGNWVTLNINWGTTTVQGKIYRVNNWIESGGKLAEECIAPTIVLSKQTYR